MEILKIVLTVFEVLASVLLILVVLWFIVGRFL